MIKRKRFPDKYNVGKSSVVPYIESEGWKERHDRRKQSALDNKEKIQSWCNNHRWSMRISNAGHHWIFITQSQKMVEWFPSSGKLAIGKQWHAGIHCHDYEQLLSLFKTIQEA